MTSTIVFVTDFPDAATAAQEITPSGFELAVVAARSQEYKDALKDSSYLVGFVDSLVDDELFETGPNLKLIQLLSAGYDRADIEAARKAGVPIANNGGANSVAVSEHAVLLMLAVSRQLVRQHTSVAAGNWRGNETPRVHELRNKTLGIVGLGTIGKKTARLAAAFGMNIIYYDIARLAEHEEDAIGVRFRLLKELLRESDLISLHTPLNDTTRHLIDAEELSLMKESAILVNTARGPVINEAALYDALTEGKILAAGLDVFDQEPPQPDNPLFKLDNVILSAHLAGPTFESNIARVRNAFDNVQRVARGEKPLWVIPELEE
ncbi:MAG: 2-hydroxyacid dehydrogenase [Pseudomonadota bacterium]|nr:2-hydroxyacid dehydrogenase [Pseudomonadota bacterium]MEC7655189.1 2-hydroxyacid dehydrogenase [Pseudomonadota bacterium]MEC8201450.1 2-hydroxyacid dehydrogenase [Pseudomonadota bacterium]MEC8697927.1 2-hydroxyacid dehydrogenase [Pseudomonadota bacterium]MED5358996.1 2-hydroxyacid dehydrogenase [Pseudomonadota bacterium]